jgi:lactate 2-monooxygenase
MCGKVLPDSFEGWEEQARLTMDVERFRYISSGAGQGETIGSNIESFKRWKIVPRVFRDVSTRDSSTNILGTRLAAPLLLAPVRGLSYVHRDGDIGVARAAAALGIPLVVSSFSTVPLERIAESMGSSPRWFQLYPGKDEEIMASLLRRAESSGYSAIVVTVDKPDDYPKYSGPRGHEHDKHGFEVYFSDPVFRRKFGGVPEEKFDAAWRYWKEIRLAAGLPPDGLRHLTKLTKLPMVVKGILDPRDAKLAIESGAAGIVVSNHGGRSLDGEVASLDALVEVRRAMGPEFPVLLDSGVHSGADVIKALALGANAVLLGKAYLLALGVAGEEGVRHLLTRVIKELDSAMAVCGATTIGEIDRTMVR